MTAQQPAAPAETNTPPPPSPESSRDDGRAQYPRGLANSFVSLSLGYIHYPFSERQLDPGQQATSIDVPHVAARAMLFGHHFGKYLSAQASYMRPVKYVRYRNLNGSDASRTVWMHFGTVTAQARLPVGERLSFYGEGGLAVTSRRGFDAGQGPAIKDARFTSVLLGAGFEYRVTSTVDLIAGSAYIPPHSKDNNPHTLFTAAGVRYNMRPLPAARVAETIAADFRFPANLIQGGYTTDAVGFAVNNFLSKTVPVFWGGHVEVKRSVVSVQYQRNVFHTKKVFAFDVGAGFTEWRSHNNDRFRTLSGYPLARFTFLRLKPADLYAAYSVAGPTYISKVVIDGLHTGSHFTFQDFMALGSFVGSQRRLNVEINLNHYSNGNLMNENAGVRIPLTLKLGYAF